MNKQALRKIYIEKRAEISEETVSDWSIEIANKVLTLPIWGSQIYHLFLPITSKKEVDTSFLLSVLQGKDKEVLVPKVTPEGTLEHYLLTDATPLRVNRWGIPEPTQGIRVSEHQIEVVFVPLLAFDQQGHRIGYGKGMYDGFLQKCSPNVIKVGLSFFEAEAKFKEVFETDIALNYCVTPQNVYRF